jgi:hypothetical protein
LDQNKSHSDDYLSNSNILYLELIPPSQYPNDYDDSYYQFKLFFTTFTPKLHVGLNDDLYICPIEHLIDCEDSYCVHANARCNGINECRSKTDEEFCLDDKSHGETIYYLSNLLININYIFIFIRISTL